MSNVMITAHSGCEGTPDNSLLSVMTAIEVGADAAEVDVRLFGDRQLYLTHDDAVDTANLVPLRAAMAAARDGGIGLNLDLKMYEALIPTLDLAEEVGLAPKRTILSGSVNVEWLLKDASIGKRAEIYINSEEICRYLAPEKGDRNAQAAYLADNAREVARLMRDMGARALNAPYQFFTDDMFRAFADAGIALSLWTVNNEDDIRRVLEKRPLNITTRAPRLALRLARG